MRDLSVLRRKKTWRKTFLLAIVALAAVALLVYQIPSVQARVNWKVDEAFTYMRGVINPVKPIPTAAPVDPNAGSGATEILQQSTSTPTPTATRLPPTATPVFSPTPTLTPTPIPGKVVLPAPQFEKQNINNCGPATLVHYLRFYGWVGNQNDITAIIKPNADDRNVNVEELVYFARNYAGWLKTEYRVGGNIDLLRKFIAAGLPVMIEEGAMGDVAYWPNDDLWNGHYLFVNGYDDSLKSFVVQDSWLGPNRQVSYINLDKHWQDFNRVYILIYPPDKESIVQSMLGDDWDVDANRKNALAQSQAETEKDPNNAFAWFNLGSNQTYFEDYVAAAKSYDKARQIGLPQRMLRYQFGAFIAYFHSGRTADLMVLTEYALQRTPNSEEALLWRGWGLLRTGKKAEAIDLFNKALEDHPGYTDAEYALNFAQNN